jgi:hypothetical protein
MSRITKRIFATLALSLLAAAFTGCGSGNKEGASGISGSALFGGVATVNETTCASCHSSTVDPLTGEPVYGDTTNGYINSAHSRAYGCQECHGGGAGHNGVGPLPFPDPSLSTGGQSHCATCHSDATIVSTVDSSIAKFVDSRHAIGDLEVRQKCNRCHTHQGAILSNLSGYTGDKNVMDALVGAPGDIIEADALHIKCNTCHVSHRPENLRTVVGWSPSITPGSAVNAGNDQYKLCTSCHTYLNPDGTVVASGTAGTAPFEHNTRWYRMIASTHYDNPATTTVIEGYVPRNNGSSPCLDCHGHEYITNTRQDEATPRPATIHTDWAKSGHAGQLIQTKYDAANAAAANPAIGDRTTGQVEAVMAAGAVESTGAGWVHYNWDDTASRGSCQACHTSTGISNYLTQQTTDLTGYNSTGANNSFTHLSGWSPTGGSPQNEMLYCWGCHSNSGTGALRNTSQAILTFRDPSSNPIVITDAGKSSACIVCHGGRGSAGEAILTPSSRFNGHHAPTAGILYSEQTHIGFEYPGQSYANPAFFQHDQIGANAAGPCASCHMGPSATDGKPSHSFAALTESGGVITAVNNQALCNTCHTPGGAFEITPALMEEERDGFHQASTILNNYLENVTGYTNYLNANIISTFATAPEGAYRAYQNGKIGGTLGGTFGATTVAARAGEEPCAYVHNRFYIKRLVFDSIDWMLDGTIDNTITLSAQTIIDYPEAVAWLGANPTTGVATRP